jgi:hypothetical protein
MRGQPIFVKQDLTFQDGTKVLVTGMPAGLGWQELKDHFAQVGDVQFTNIGRSTDSPVAKAVASRCGAVHVLVKFDTK